MALTIFIPEITVNLALEKMVIALRRFNAKYLAMHKQVLFLSTGIGMDEIIFIQQMLMKLEQIFQEEQESMGEQ